MLIRDSRLLKLNTTAKQSEKALMIGLAEDSNFIDDLISALASPTLLHLTATKAPSLMVPYKPYQSTRGGL